MLHFPVTNSTLSATHLGILLQEKYDLPPASTCRLIRCGINDTYLLDTGDSKYVFRIYSLNWRTRTEILEEFRLLARLREQHIPVSYAVADKHQQYIQILAAPEGERMGAMFSYAPGEKLPNISEELHFKIGELIARLHRITRQERVARVDYTSKVLITDSLQEISKFLPEETAEMTFMRSTGDYLLDAFSKFDTAHIRSGVVHLDIWFDNLNITGEQEVTIFDFDFCGNGWLCLDVAYYVLQLTNLEKEPLECQRKRDSFLRGYASVAPLSEEELRIIPMLGVSLYFFYLGVQCRRFDNWSNVFLNASYLKRYIKAMVMKYFESTGLGEIENR